MDNSLFLEVALGFILGIVGTFLYDLYSKRREKDKLIFVRGVKSQFRKGDLDDEIAEKVSISYQSVPIESIDVFMLTVVNSSKKAISGHSFTITFSEKSRIVSVDIKASSEVSNYIQKDPKIIESHKSRYGLGWLLNTDKIEFEFIVVNHSGGMYTIENGLLSPADTFISTTYAPTLDINVVVTDSNVIYLLDNRITRSIWITFLILITGLLRIIPGQVEEFVSPLATSGISILSLVLQASLFFILFKELAYIIPQLIDSFRPSEHQRIAIHGNVSGADVVIGGTQTISGDLSIEMRSESDVKRDVLQSLVDQLHATLKTISSDNAEEIEILAQLVLDEVNKPKPSLTKLTVTGESLLKSAENFPTVAPIVSKIVQVLLGRS